MNYHVKKIVALKQREHTNGCSVLFLGTDACDLEQFFFGLNAPFEYSVQIFLFCMVLTRFVTIIYNLALLCDLFVDRNSHPDPLRWTFSYAKRLPFCILPPKRFTNAQHNI